MLRWIILFLLTCTSHVNAQHTRLYAVVLGNDDPANFMAGSSLGSGLWQSDDTGRTWKQLGWKHIKAYSMDHDSNGRILYLAAGNGVLKSTDHGESWRVMTDWRVAEVMDVKVIARQPNIVLAATAHGMIRSTDAGHSWSLSHSGIEMPYVSRLHLGRDQVYACAESGLYASADLGKTWRRIWNGSAVRAISNFKDLHLAVGDSSWALIRHDNTIAIERNASGAHWDAHYSPGSNVRFVSGINGVGRFWEKEYITYEGPRNVHAVVSIGETVFAGTLGEGLWANDSDGAWRAIALPRSNIWSLHIARVK